MVCDRSQPLTMNKSKSHHHHSSFCSTSSSPVSPKSEDISRLMDPSYASTSTASSSSPCSGSYPTVYVDHDGEFHDPDYQQFPIFKRQERHQRERDYEDVSDEEDLDRDGEDMNDYYSRRRSSSLTRGSERRHKRRSRTLSPLPLTLGLPPLSSSPSPSSLSTDDDIIGTPEHSGHVLRKKRSPHTKKSLFNSPTYSPSHLSTSPTYSYSSSEPSPYLHSPEFADHADFDLYELSESEDPSLPQIQIHTVRPESPTAGDALKKEWHAISLSVSMGMFRMRRKVKEVIAARA